jgi:phosphohistidine phosphatase
MDFYLIRHAEAQPVGEAGITRDEDRPLTEDGRSQCQPLAAALARRAVKVDQVVSSPLLRARQTAESLMQHLPTPAPQLHLCDHLGPGGKRRKLTRFVRNLEGASFALVGHMPDLATYAGWLMGSKKAQLDLAKAGVACLHFESRPGKGQGVLTWLVGPDWYDHH